MKTIDLSKSVYDLSNQYPEFVSIMVELGFKDIANPMTLQSMGRFVNVIKGSEIHNVPMDTIIKKFEEKGFEVVKYNQ